MPCVTSASTPPEAEGKRGRQENAERRFPSRTLRAHGCRRDRVIPCGGDNRSGPRLARKAGSAKLNLLFARSRQVDFNYSGMYSIYNWELFFHIPLLVAARLSQNQKFEDARKWFHYIFDPTRAPLSAASGAERFWITKPFKEEILKGILPIEDLLNNGSPDLDLQLHNWEQNPFNPHAVARLRISVTCVPQ